MGNQRRCTGERLGVVATLEECCQPRSIGGLEGGGYTMGSTADCSPCPTNSKDTIHMQ